MQTFVHGWESVYLSADNYTCMCHLDIFLWDLQFVGMKAIT